MALSLTALTPETAKPGDTLSLTGTDFLAGAAVLYSGSGIGATDIAAVVDGPTQITSKVPDLLQGCQGQISVQVIHAGAGESNALPLSIQAAPEIEPIVELCSIGAVKAMLGVALSETFDDVKLRELIQIASAQVASYCDRVFAVQEYIEALDGNGSKMLDLTNTPIVEVLSLAINGIAIPVQEVKWYESWICLTDVEYSARLRGGGRVFPYGLKNVHVSYVAGYQRIPAVLSKACQLQVSHLLNTANKQGQVSEANQTAGVTNQLSSEDLCAAARRHSNQYRRVRVGIV